MKRLSALWLFLAILIVGCQSDPQNGSLESEIQGFQDVVYNTSKTIRNNGNYLDFAFYDEFEAIRKYSYNISSNISFKSTNSNLKNKHPKDLANELNFNSLGHKYERLLKIQEDYLEGLRGKYGHLSEEELRDIDIESIPKFAPEIYKNEHLLELDETNVVFRLKIHDDDLAFLLNEKGIISVAGALYQYTGDVVKFMPLNGVNTVEDLIQAKQDNNDNGIRVNKVTLSYPELSGDRASETQICTGGGTGWNIYHNGSLKFQDYSTYVYEYVCAYDSAYYTCWYQNTPGLSYEEKIRACCQSQPVLRNTSRFTASINSRTSCGFTFIFWCIGGSQGQSVDLLEIDGSFNYYRNGIFHTTNGVNVSRTNSAYLSTTIYDGNQLNVDDVRSLVNFRAMETIPGRVYDFTCQLRWR